VGWVFGRAPRVLNGEGGRERTWKLIQSSGHIVRINPFYGGPAGWVAGRTPPGPPDLLAPRRSPPASTRLSRPGPPGLVGKLLLRQLPLRRRDPLASGNGCRMPNDGHGEVVRYQSYTPGRDAEGDIDALSLWSGQSVGLVSEIKPAGDIVREIVAQARSTLRKLVQ
jgi:hypothetical protein